MRRLPALLPLAALIALSLGRAGTPLRLFNSHRASSAQYVVIFSFAGRAEERATAATTLPPSQEAETNTAGLVAVATFTPATFPTTIPALHAEVASILPTEVPTPTQVPPTPTPTLTPLPSPTPTNTLLPPTATPLPPTATPLAPAAAPKAVAAAPEPAPQQPLRDRLVAAAQHYVEVKTKYRSGHTGPELFDCTGLVYRVFADCAAEELIGAKGEKGVRDYYRWFSERGRADLEAPRSGDLIIYGNYVHIGIYVGDERAISTLNAGVREHDAFRLRNGNSGPIMAIKAYLHIEAE